MQRRWLGFALVLACLSTAATAKTWTGASSGFWSDPANWSPASIPAALEPLTFTADAARRATTNDLPPITLGEVVVQGAYSLAGNPITLGGYFATGFSGSIDVHVPVTIAADVNLGAHGPMTLHQAVDVNGRARHPR